MAKKSAIVIGAGIVGLATARALAVRNYQVTVIERNTKAIGASIRNFGMIWPIGQPDGELYERALISQDIWKQICVEAGIWYEHKGSLHLAYNADESEVLQELNDIYEHRNYLYLNKQETIAKTEAVQKNNLLGSLFSQEEMVVDPRQAISIIPKWLNEKFNVEFIWGMAITDIAYPSVYAGSVTLEADEIFVCSGFDFETLYPQIFSSLPLTKCTLQMMRLAAPGKRIGPSLCGALSLMHYHSFKVAPSWGMLRDSMQNDYPQYIENGIHVMVSQNELGELTVGDSHQYGDVNDPFDKSMINELILAYLEKFSSLNSLPVTETWNGVYAKMTNGNTEFVIRPETGVTIINGLGGAGMTLSFGLCEQVVAGSFSSVPTRYKIR